jgi:hypothetical protein
VKDAEWIAQLLEHGLLRPSFVPRPEIRRLRNLTRYRVQLMGDRTRDATRLEKLLEDAQLTELADFVSRVWWRPAVGVATFRARDRSTGCAAGSVGVGGSTARVA